MPKQRRIEDAVGVSTVKVERTSGGAQTGTIDEVIYDHGGGPLLLVLEKSNGDHYLIPWVAVRSIVIDEEDLL